MDELTALVILNNTPLLGPIKARQLISYFGSAAEALETPSSTSESLIGFGPKIAQSLRSWRENSSWQRDLDLIERLKIELIAYNDPRYPKRLLEIPDHPTLLYCRGTLKRADDQGIAVVGTRNATIYGQEMSRLIAKQLAAAQYTVVSGLARGIDTAAHDAALECGRSIAVLGCGLAHMYPRENGPLADRIATNGAVLSEFPMQTPPDRQHFPQRNRIVSGMTLATVLIEAPVHSGAMITMQKAQGQGRRLFALPGRADCDSFRGNHLLIKQGLAQLIENGDDVVEAFGSLFGYCGIRESTPRSSICHLEPQEAELLAKLPSEELTIDEIIIRSGLPVMKVQVLLMSLMLKKQVKEFPGKIYKKTAHI